MLTTIDLSILPVRVILFTLIYQIHNQGNILIFSEWGNREAQQTAKLQPSLMVNSATIVSS